MKFVNFILLGIQFVDDNGTEGDLDGAIICENTATDTQIYQLKAIDYEGPVRYSIFGELSSYVSLDVDTGIITLTRKLDREVCFLQGSQNKKFEFFLF